MANTRFNDSFNTGSDLRRGSSNQFRDYTDFGVLLGNWFEERARAEAETEELLEKYSHNELPFQKLDFYVNYLSIPSQLTRNLDGYLHHGDLIRLKWKEENGKSYFLSALPMRIGHDGSFSDPCLALATEDSRFLIRTVFHVFRNDNNIPNYIPLMYGERILICTNESSGHRMLHCEPKAFNKFAKQSRHQDVTWEKELTARALWKILPENKNSRKKAEGQYVLVNTNIVLSHLSTGQLFALEKDSSVSTTFGFEKEVTGHTFMNAFKLEGIENKWQFEAPKIKSSDYGEPMKFPTA